LFVVPLRSAMSAPSHHAVSKAIVFAPSAETPATRASAPAPPLAVVENVAAQPLQAQVQRVMEALEHLGNPLPARVRTALAKADKEPDEAGRGAASQAAAGTFGLGA